MRNLEAFIESGILELYVLGIASAEEKREAEEMLAAYEEVREEIERISEALQSYSERHAAIPNATIKPMILASIDYEERLRKGEQPSNPPILNNNSTFKDYSQWLDREDMVIPTDFNGIHAKLIGHTPQATSAIVWIQSETPYEKHHQEHEKFLILEGTCDIIIDEKVHHLVPGDYMSIPLHAGHYVKVTSTIPCKVILQRVAA
jgi:mannose-6-phosphate isomerase-like protein (cupin superfamily)